VSISVEMQEEHEVFFLECWEVKRMRSAELEELTREFLKNGGVIQVLKPKSTETISYYEILREYKINEKDLREKITTGRFAPALTDNMSRNVRMEAKSWLVSDVELYLVHGKRGYNDGPV